MRSLGFFGGALVTGLLWVVGAFFFVLEAWGSRGMAKPWWMGIAAIGTWCGWIVPLMLAIVGLVLLFDRRPPHAPES